MGDFIVEDTTSSEDEDVEDIEDDEDSEIEDDVEEDVEEDVEDVEGDVEYITKLGRGYRMSGRGGSLRRLAARYAKRQRTHVIEDSDNSDSEDSDSNAKGAHNPHYTKEDKRYFKTLAPADQARLKSLETSIMADCIHE